MDEEPPKRAAREYPYAMKLAKQVSDEPVQPDKPLNRFERIFGRTAPVKLGFEWLVMVVAMGLIFYFTRRH